MSSSTVDIATVTQSIAGLSISGVTIKALSAIPPTVGDAAKLLIPDPSQIISDYRIESVDVAEITSDVSYILHLLYIHCPIAQDISKAISATMEKATLILVALNPDVELNGADSHDAATLDAIGQIEDPAGNIFWGARISLRIYQTIVN